MELFTDLLCSLGGWKVMIEIRIKKTGAGRTQVEMSIQCIVYHLLV